MYEFPAQAGQFVQVLIGQSSLMFDARLLAPDRSELAVVNNADGDDDARSLLAIAAATGTYRVQIGRYRTSGGSYRVAVATVRAALPDDAKRVEADRAYREGGRLRVQATADSFTQAIVHYDVALRLWRELGDRRNEALTLLQAGGARYLLGESRAALDLFEHSLTMWRAIDDRIKIAAALSNAAVCLNNLGEPARALAYYSEALPLLQSADRRPAEANTLSNIGRVHATLGEHQQALDYFERALPIWALSDDARQPNTLANIGLEHWTLGQPTLARTYLEQALALYRQQGDNNGVALVLNNLGLVLKSDEPARARELFEQALTLPRAGGDRRAEAAVLQNLGSSYADEGRHDRARDYFAQALALRRTTGDRTGEASTLAQLGASYVDTGDVGSGLAPLTESLTIADEIGNPQAAATVRYQLARVDRAAGRLSEALTGVNAALTWSESVRASVLSPDVRATYFATVRYQYDLLIDLLMRLHRQRPDAGFDARALEASERARARSMLDLLIEARGDIRQDVDPALLERERQASTLVTTKTERRMRLASGPSNPTELAAADKEIDGAAAALRAVEDTLRTRSPHYAALTQPQPLTVADIQARALDDRSALLEYWLGADRTVLWVVTRGSLTSYELPPRAEVERVARRAYQAVTTVGSPDSAAALRALSDMILAPALAQVGTRRLLVVADGALQYVPFAALPGRNGLPLALAHESVSLPSASTLVLLRGETAGRQAAPESVAILADPVFDRKDSRVTGGPATPAPSPGDADDSLERSARDFGLGGFDRLASTRSEADTIAALGGAGHVFKAVDFNAGVATRLLRDAGCVSLGTDIEEGQMKGRFYTVVGVTFLAAVCLRAVVSGDRTPGDLQPLNDPTGAVLTITTNASFDGDNPFFQSLGTNGRSCGTCHQASDAWTVTPAHVRQRFDASNGLDPIFRLNDGANCSAAEVSTLQARRRAYSLLLAKGLIRIELAMPAHAEFSLIDFDDPYGCITSSALSMYRRPLPSTNLKFLSTLMWDGREMHSGRTMAFNLTEQARDATFGHAQGAVSPTDQELQQIVNFESGLFTGQIRDRNAGRLDDDGAIGGPAALPLQPFFIGINDPIGLNPTNAPFDPRAFSLFNAWMRSGSPDDGDEDTREARRTIARGQELFNTRRIDITGVGGLNDALGAASIPGTCTTCHDTPNSGNHSVSMPLNIGTSDASRRTPDLPLYTFVCNTTGETINTSDPGRALITGKCADQGKVKGPILRALAARAPYFHNGSAASLAEVVDFYDERFQLHLKAGEKSDLVAFLRSL